MRDPARIYSIMNRLAAVWQAAAPDQRLGQFLINTLDIYSCDPFFPECEEMIESIERMYGVK